jgi:hypothetical protein
VGTSEHMTHPDRFSAGSDKARWTADQTLFVPSTTPAHPGYPPIPIIMQFDETFDVGADTGTPVNDTDYKVPFDFTGTLDKLTIKIDRPKLTPDDEKRLIEGAAKAADAR